MNIVEHNFKLHPQLTYAILNQVFCLNLQCVNRNMHGPFNKELKSLKELILIIRSGNL